MRISAKELLAQRGQLDKDVVAALVDGALLDLHTPIDPAAKVEPRRPDHPRAIEVIRHPPAPVMAAPVDRPLTVNQDTIRPAISKCA